MKHLVVVLSLGWGLAAPAPLPAAALRGTAAGSPRRGAAMPRRPVSSPTIASVGYEPSTGTLEVEFMNGAIVQYDGVPMAVYAGLVNAPSPGSFFVTHVDGRYPYRAR